MFLSSSTLLRFRSRLSTTHRTYFDKVLIANRGEIAERVIRTCQQLGIQTAAIYSTADANAEFVHLADESYCVGPPQDSYLNIPNIVQAIQDSKADAVHPGYGFLSENADFCRAVGSAGATFLGPTVSNIQQLGDKVTSKDIAVASAVNVIPGYQVDSVEQALEHAESIKYPVLLKAAAGGGGKGMRVCATPAELGEYWGLAKSEALKFFADDRIIVEKYIENPHHIEFQVLGEKNGIVVFAERECSIQRRNQKIVEESPSVILTESMRSAMVDQVRNLCSSINYRSAGTVEFLVDDRDNFYFLEMNTRLQVEHPITEEISKVDLVKCMLQVGAGESTGLPTTGVVPYSGHAMEARVYAEDPVRGFVPSTGPLLQYHEPTSIRVDSGVDIGSIVSPHYDPMLSKAVAYGETREEAIGNLRSALDDYVIHGVQHNVRLVRDILQSKRFQAGDTPTNYLQLEYPDGFKSVKLSAEQTAEYCVAAFLIQRYRESAFGVVGLAGETAKNEEKKGVVVVIGGQFGVPYSVTLGEKEAVVQKADGSISPISVSLEEDVDYKGSTCRANVTLNGRPRTLQVLGKSPSGELRLSMAGFEADVLLQSPREHELSTIMQEPELADQSGFLVSPMPGLLLSFAVKPGDSVEIGQELCVIESMKMQNLIRSERAGTIKNLKVDVGASVKVDELLLEFED